MRSHAEAPQQRKARKAFEAACRAALLLALAAAMYLALTSMGERPSVSVRGDEASVRSALREWSTSSSPREAQVRFDSTPSAVTRAWAASLPGTGTRVTWSSPVPAIAVSAEALADPKGATRVLVAAPPGARVALEDSLGRIDTLSVRSRGASLGPVLIHGPVGASVNGAAAVSGRMDSLVVRPVLVIGRAGWEGKFVATALEEYGWHVNARLTVSPGNEATQGPVGLRIDTANYSAVVVVDSSASRFSPAILRYVESGGGLVAIGEGASLASLQRIMPARAGSPSPAGDFNSARPRNALSLRPLFNLRGDAIPLEKRGERIAIAARRTGAGRVLQVGYDDVWRWRMAGGGDAVEDQRNWISSVVSSAAYAPRIELSPLAVEPAPTAAMFSALGPPASARASARSENARIILLVLFIVALAALVAETASRRLDGRA